MRPKKTHEQYLQDLVARGINIVPLESYRGSNVRIKFECVKGHTWITTATAVLCGKGCPRCSMAKGIYNEKYFEKYPEEGDRPGVLYCVVLVDKATMERKCIKIGITQGTSYKDVAKRAVGFTGYETRVQKIVRGRLEDIYYLEQYLHERWQDKKYKSDWKFGGHSELFELDDEIIRSIPKEV